MTSVLIHSESPDTCEASDCHLSDVGPAVWYCVTLCDESWVW